MANNSKHLLSTIEWHRLLSRDQRSLPRCCDEIDFLYTSVIRIRRDGANPSSIAMFVHWYKIASEHHNLCASRELTLLAKKVTSFQALLTGQPVS